MRFYKCILLLAMCVLAIVDANAQSDRQFIRNGNRLYRQQNYAKAEIEYRKALGKNPSNPQALYNLGTALLMQQKDSAAVSQLQNAAKCETSKLRKAKVWHNIGVACQKHKLFSDAIKAYEESLRNNPADNETRYNLALCMRQQKNQKNQDKQQNKDKNKQKQKQNKNDKNNKDKNQDQQQKQQKQQEKMSKDNAEQLLNYAEQEEKQTQQRLKKQEAQPQRRRLEKNW
ncbi:MAG TPA: aerotolerance regulator BatC [Prevotella sp.]|nr:aerotolerance regulator BatC [Prevotella sp.]